MRVFIGLDPRDLVSYNVCQWSIIRNASKPVSITPLALNQLPITRKGLTHFTFSRYLVPQLCGFRGRALFIDSDIVVNGDVHALNQRCQETIEHDAGKPAVWVRKDIEQFEWPSVMLFENALCERLTVDYIEDEDVSPSDFSWASRVGELPIEWNFCVDYDSMQDLAEMQDGLGVVKRPGLVHYTAGTPGFKERRWCDFADDWHKYHEEMNSQVSWMEIHGDSVHTKRVFEQIQHLVADFNGESDEG